MFYKIHGKTPLILLFIYEDYKLYFTKNMVEAFMKRIRYNTDKILKPFIHEEDYEIQKATPRIERQILIRKCGKYT